MSQSAIATTDPVVFQCSGGLIKGKLSVDLGRVELTGRYLVFYRKPFWTRMFGLLGAIAGYLFGAGTDKAGSK